MSAQDHLDAARTSIDAKPMVVVKFGLADGTFLERTWTWAEVQRGERPALGEGPPPWLLQPLKRWDHPQDPITYTGDVEAGHEADARKLLGLDS